MKPQVGEKYYVEVRLLRMQGDDAVVVSNSYDWLENPEDLISIPQRSFYHPDSPKPDIKHTHDGKCYLGCADADYNKKYDACTFLCQDDCPKKKKNIEEKRLICEQCFDGVPGGVHASYCPNKPEEKRIKWEYWGERFDKDDAEDEINALGDKGWELIQAIYVPGKFERPVFYFKRLKS